MPAESENSPVPVPAPTKPMLPSKSAEPVFSKPSELEASRGYVRPHRDAVVHVRRDGGGKPMKCPVTILPKDHADFHARSPGVIDVVNCTACRAPFKASEFVWNGTDEVVGT